MVYRKKTTATIAMVTAATLLLSGTFAWQSISQEATNIITSEVNPGGRLHDDFDGSNDKNIYVENFGTQNIYARVKLSEYLEIGQNAGDTEFESRQSYLDDGAINVLAGTSINDKSTYATYYYDENDISDETNASDKYWTKEWGGKTKYIPTFNKDQDSLDPDLNGTFEYVDSEGNADPYGDFVDYNATNAPESVSGTEWYDADTNDTHEEHVTETSISAGNHKVVENVTHNLTESTEGTVITMTEWMTTYESAPGDYWVYDTDGWAYWANPIEPGEATGLLLTAINDLGLIDEDYYYAILVTGQFITAGDLGNAVDEDKIGFYADGEENYPSTNALILLDSIGVNVGEQLAAGTVTIAGQKTWALNGSNVTLPSSITVHLKVGEEIVASKVVSPDTSGNWWYTFTMPKYNANGEEITYAIGEEAIEGYTATISGYNITNTYATDSN